MAHVLQLIIETVLIGMRVVGSSGRKPFINDTLAQNEHFIASINITRVF